MLADIDPAMPTGDLKRLEAIVERAVSPRRFILLLITAFAGTALLLAALGLCAVLSYSVSQHIPKSASEWPSARPPAQCAAASSDGPSFSPPQASSLVPSFPLPQLVS